jgi:hypothetical protein
MQTGAPRRILVQVDAQRWPPVVSQLVANVRLVLTLASVGGSAPGDSVACFLTRPQVTASLRLTAHRVRSDWSEADATYVRGGTDELRAER